jgi:hypothetical protein
MTAKISIDNEDLPDIPVSRRSAEKDNSANSKYVGKVCPYCHNAIKSNSDIVVCPVCDTPHHADCWSENGGCTTYGCSADNTQNNNLGNSYNSSPINSSNWISRTFFLIAGVIAFGMIAHFHYGTWVIVDTGIIIIAIIAGINSSNKV